MKTITVDQLVIVLAQINHACPVTFTAFTDARARKTGNPYDEIRKLSRVHGFTGFNYEASVNRQLEREGKEATFVAQERVWGDKVSSCLVSNNGKFYLIVKPQGIPTPMFFGVKNGAWKHLTANEVGPFLPPKYLSTNQGTDTEVQYRNYALENIRNISIGGEKYTIRLAA